MIVLIAVYYDTYGGEYWNNMDGDVHVRSGVQNHWFYLLSEGSSATDGVNDNGYVFNVVGIGKEKAAAIAYRNLSVYLISSSNYAEARQGAIESARDLFGDCSNEVLQTVEAWNAVGVYAPSIVTNQNVCGDFYKDNFPHIFIATNTIFSAGNVCDEPPYANATIHSDATVVFKAGNEIILGPGFTAEAGSDFHAYIFTCAGGSFRYADDNEHQQPQIISQHNTSPANNSNDLIISPNPFTSTTQIKYTIEDIEDVNIELFDIYGRKIITLVNQTQHPKGTFALVFERKQLPTGIYFCNFKTNKLNISKKLIILQ